MSYINPNNFNHLKLLQRIVEHWPGKEETNINRSKESKESSTEISKDMVVNATTKILSSAINEAASKNSAELTKALSASNKIALSGAKGKGFKLSGIKQSAEVKSKTEGEIVQKIASQMSNDISNSISKIFSQASEDIKKLKEDTKIQESEGSTVGEVTGQIAGMANNLVDNLFGGKTTNITETEKSLKEAFKLSEDFKVDDEDIVENTVKNQMSSENLAKCAEQSAAENEINLADIDAGDGEIEISDIEQTALVDSAMKCAFNQEILTEMANKIANKVEKTFEKISKSLDEQEKTTDISKQKGDLAALGDAVSKTVVAAGDATATAAKGLGEGVSTAAKGAGEGISTAAKGVGEGVSSALSGLVMPLVIIAVLALIAGGAYLMFRQDFE